MKNKQPQSIREQKQETEKKKNKVVQKQEQKKKQNEERAKQKKNPTKLNHTLTPRVPYIPFFNCET